MFPGAKPNRFKALAWILLAAACLVTPAMAQDTGNCTVKDPSTRPDCPGAIAFFEKLQAAVKDGDKNQLASMVAYPLRSFQNGKRVQVRTRDRFLKQYLRMLTPAVICAIGAAKTSDVWGNDQGFMVGRGVIWWDQIIPATAKNPEVDSGKYPFKVVAINNQDVMVPGCGGNNH
jgi:hypothetical protein